MVGPGRSGGRVRRAGDTHGSTGGLGNHVKALEARIRAVGPEPLDLSVDDPRIDGRDNIIPQTQLSDGARAVILDQDVKMGHEPLEQAHPFFAFEIDADALFAGVQQEKIGRVEPRLIGDEVSAPGPRPWAVQP